MEDFVVYRLSEIAHSFIERDIHTMGEWLSSLSDKELNAFCLICNKDIVDRNEEEEFEISKHSLVLYFKELEIDELSISEKKLSELSSLFCLNVITEALIRRGLATVSEPLTLYKDNVIKLTQKGRDISENFEGETFY